MKITETGKVIDANPQDVDWVLKSIEKLPVLAKKSVQVFPVEVNNLLN